MSPEGMHQDLGEDPRNNILSPGLTTRRPDLNSLEGMETIAEKLRENNPQDLRSRSLPLYELTHIEQFIVAGVQGITEAHNITESNNMIGPGYWSTEHMTGHSKRLEIQVEPYASSTHLPINSLTFQGDSPIRAGDRIRATVARFDTVKVERDFYHERGEEEFYLDRPYQAKETAVQIDILDKHGNLLRSDNSSEYSDFVKPEKPNP